MSEQISETDSEYEKDEEERKSYNNIGLNMLSNKKT